VEKKYPMKVGKRTKKGTIIHTTRKKSFVVTHFAGEVEYNDWKNFYARSVDVLSAHLYETFGASTNTVLSALFGKAKTSGSSSGSSSGKKKKKKKISVGKQFQSALTKLVNSITATNVYYIRCLKSNIEQDANRFDAKYVDKQMMQAGLPAAGDILVAGYPHKFTLLEFYKFNCDVVPVLHGRRDKDLYMENPKAFCTLFCTHVKEMPAFHGFKGTIVGKELVLLGIHEYRSFVQFRSSRLAIISVQASYRGRRARKGLRKSRMSVNTPRPTRKKTAEVVGRYDSMTDLLV
jgi:hypothetical protein